MGFMINMKEKLFMRMSKKATVFSILIVMFFCLSMQKAHSQVFDYVEKDGIIIELYGSSNQKYSIYDNEVVIKYKEDTPRSKAKDLEIRNMLSNQYVSTFDFFTEDSYQWDKYVAYNLNNLKDIDSIIESDIDNIIEYISPAFRIRNDSKRYNLITDVIFVWFKETTKEDERSSLFEKYQLRKNNDFGFAYTGYTGFKNYNQNLKIIDKINTEKAVKIAGSSLVVSNALDSKDTYIDHDGM